MSQIHRFGIPSNAPRRTWKYTALQPKE